LACAATTEVRPVAQWGTPPASHSLAFRRATCGPRARIELEFRACFGWLRGRTGSGHPVSPRCSAGAHRRALDIIQLGAADPSLRHSGPHGLVLTAARELGHKLAFCGKSKEFLRRIHGLAFPVLVLPDQQNPKAFRRFLVEIDFVGCPPAAGGSQSPAPHPWTTQPASQRIRS
jgi:hypothetical protein